jgi:hypothetical protein
VLQLVLIPKSTLEIEVIENGREEKVLLKYVRTEQIHYPASDGTVRHASLLSALLAAIW